MKEVDFAILPETFAKIKGTTLAQRMLLSLTSRFPEKGLRYNNVVLGVFFQVSPNRMSHLITKLIESGYMIVFRGQSPGRRLYLDRNHPELIKIAEIDKRELRCNNTNRNCLHCYFEQSIKWIVCYSQQSKKPIVCCNEQSSLLKTTKSYKGAKEDNDKGRKEPVCDDKLNPAIPTDSRPQRTIKQTKAEKKNTDAGFDRFWAEYPKKAAEKTARQVWNKLKPDKTLTDTILAALEKHKGQPGWKKENGRYVSKASNWLADERWKDAITEFAPGDYDSAANSLTHELTEKEADELYERIAADDN